MGILDIIASWIKFRPSQIKGFTLLYLIVFGLLCISLVFRYWMLSGSEPLFSPIYGTDSLSVYHDSNQMITEISEKHHRTMFFFDPNLLSNDSLCMLGLPLNVVKNIDKYRSKGGRFRQKSDLMKIYGLSQQDFDQLSSWIQIQSTQNNSLTEKSTSDEQNLCEIDPELRIDINRSSIDSINMLCISNALAQQWIRYRTKIGSFERVEQLMQLYRMDSSTFNRIAPHLFVSTTPAYKKTELRDHSSSFKSEYVQIDINHSTMEDWMQLPGIGFTLAKRVVQFRSSLGGFHSIGQLLDVTGVRDSVFQKLIPYLIVSKDQAVKTINLNTVTMNELVAHPYIKWYHAKEILTYRDEFGRFTSIDELQILESFFKKKGLLIKLAPYLTVQ